MDLEQLQQNKQDLTIRKKDLSKQVSLILEANQISSRGKNRVISSIVGFPDNIVRLTDSHESALVSLLFEIKNIQIAMYAIESAIEQQKGE